MCVCRVEVKRYLLTYFRVYDYVTDQRVSAPAKDYIDRV